MQTIDYEVAVKTDRGLVKSINEDAFLVKGIKTGEYCIGLFAIADGVGGLDKGELASAIAITELEFWWNKNLLTNIYNKTSLLHSLEATFYRINHRLIKFSKRHTIKIATTLTALFLYHNEAFVFHIGDSRVYKLSHTIVRTKMKQITLDHIDIVNVCIKGRIFRKSVLTECLGNKLEICYDTRHFPLKKGDFLILCSDGLYKTLGEKVLQNYIIKYNKNIQILCDNLVQLVKDNGERDNITVIAVKIFKKG